MGQDPKITAEELSRFLGINLRNVKRNTEKLKGRRLVKRVGSRQRRTLGGFIAGKGEQPPMNPTQARDLIRNTLAPNRRLATEGYL